LASLLICLLLPVAASQAHSQPNPTPVQILLTPQVTATAAVIPTAPPVVPPDRFEPNDEAGLAAQIGWQAERDLTLSPEDPDYFTGYLKAGQWVQLSTTVYDGLDSRLTLFRNGSLVAENDDRSPTDLGSVITFLAAEEGWYLLRVTAATVYAGRYDLTAQLLAPTVTPTPTVTATPTVTPIPTLIPVTRAMPALSTPPVRLPSPSPTSPTLLTPTLRYLGRQLPVAEAVSLVQLRIYYDADSDRLPGPEEGVAGVLVWAVDGFGQRVAAATTDGRGEASLLLPAAAERLMAPAVPGWSATVASGPKSGSPGSLGSLGSLGSEDSQRLLLGLPAVRLPIFFPVAETNSEGSR